MKFVVDSVGKVASRAVVGGHELVFDQPATVPGGEDRGPSPLDLMSVTVAACAHYFAAAYLYGRGLSPQGLRVEVAAEKSRIPTPRLAAIELSVHLPPGLSERDAAGIERAIKTCPAYGTLLHPPKVELSVAGATMAGGDPPSDVATIPEKLSA